MPNLTKNLPLLLIIVFVVGAASGGYFATWLGPRNPFEKTPVFASQELSIPNARVIDLEEKNITIEDSFGQQARFPISPQFTKAVDVEQTRLNETQEQVLVDLQVGSFGTIVLGMAGSKYEVVQFYLTNLR